MCRATYHVNGMPSSHTLPLSTSTGLGLADKVVASCATARVLCVIVIDGHIQVGFLSTNIPYSRKSWRELYLADSLFLLFGGI